MLGLPELITLFMFGAAFCYTAVAVCYFLNGQLWMALTMFLYMGSIITIWMADGH